MSTATQDRIIDLWATTFLDWSPDGHEGYRDALATLAEQAPGADLLTAGDSAAVWLRSRIDEAARAYLDRWAEAPVQGFRIVSQAVIHGHGDYQPLRNDPDSYLSGIYHVAVPTDLRDDHHRSDAESNTISFYDPRFAMNMGAIAGDPNKEVEKMVQPEPGMLLIWPSFVDYFIHPNLSAAQKVSVHFRIILENGS